MSQHTSAFLSGLLAGRGLWAGRVQLGRRSEGTAGRGGAGGVGVAGLVTLPLGGAGLRDSQPPQLGGCSCGGCLAEARKGTDRMGQRLEWAGDQPLSLEASELQMSCLCITCILASFPNHLRGRSAGPVTPVLQRKRAGPGLWGWTGAGAWDTLLLPAPPTTTARVDRTGRGCSRPGCVRDQGPAIWGGRRWWCNQSQASSREGVFPGLQWHSANANDFDILSGRRASVTTSSGSSSSRPMGLEAGARRTAPHRAPLESREKRSGTDLVHYERRGGVGLALTENTELQKVSENLGSEGCVQRTCV